MLGRRGKSVQQNIVKKPSHHQVHVGVGVLKLPQLELRYQAGVSAHYFGEAAAAGAAVAFENFTVAAIKSAPLGSA